MNYRVRLYYLSEAQRNCGVVSHRVSITISGLVAGTIIDINITWTLRSTAFTFPRYACRSSKFLFTLSSCLQKKKKMKKKFPTFFHFFLIFSMNTGCPIKSNACCKKWCMYLTLCNMYLLVMGLKVSNWFKRW